MMRSAEEPSGRRKAKKQSAGPGKPRRTPSRRRPATAAPGSTASPWPTAVASRLFERGEMDARLLTTERAQPGPMV